MQLFPSSASSYLICVNVWLTREAIQGMGHNMQISSFLNIKTIKIRDLIQRVSSPQCNLLKKKTASINALTSLILSLHYMKVILLHTGTPYWSLPFRSSGQKLYKSKLGKSYPQENTKWTPWTKLLSRKSALKVNKRLRKETAAKASHSLQRVIVPSEKLNLFCVDSKGCRT